MELIVSAVLLFIIYFSQTTPAVDQRSANTCSLMGSFDVRDGVHSIGAIHVSPFNDTQTCLDACLNVIDNCVAVDVDHRPLNGFCWIHTESSALNVVYRADVRQYVVKAGCKPTQADCRHGDVTWRILPNHNSFNGMLVTSSSGTVFDCLRSCSNNENCLVVDYNQVSSDCYQFTDPEFERSRGAYPLVHQFVVRRCAAASNKRATPRTERTTSAHQTPTVAMEMTSVVTKSSSARNTATTLTTPLTTTVGEMNAESNTTRWTPLMVDVRGRATPEYAGESGALDCICNCWQLSGTLSKLHYSYSSLASSIQTTRKRTPAPTSSTFSSNSPTIVSKSTPPAASSQVTLTSSQKTAHGLNTLSTTPAASLATTRVLLPMNTACKTEWISFVDAHSPGGVQYLPSNGVVVTVALCLEHCDSMRAPFEPCFAVDIDETAGYVVKCWLHTSVTTLAFKYRFQGVTQYHIVRCPQQLTDRHTCVPDLNSDSGLDSCVKTCLPAWVAFPRATDNVINDVSCMERCLLSAECVAVGIVMGTSSACVTYANGRLPTILADYLTPGVQRYQLVDRCYTECQVVWTRHNATVYSLTDPQTLPNVNTQAVCASLCRRNSLCMMYQLTRLPDGSVVCTLAPRYSAGPISVSNEAVTSYTRSEKDCHVHEYKCETSWIPRRNTKFQRVPDKKITVSTVGECLDACSVSAGGCSAVVVVRKENPLSNNLTCYKLERFIDPKLFVQSNWSDIYVRRYQCYRTGLKLENFIAV